MDRRDDRPATRREFLESIARAGILAGLAALAALLSIDRTPSAAQGKCLGDGHCGGCPLAGDCRLQPARQDDKKT